MYSQKIEEESVLGFCTLLSNGNDKASESNLVEFLRSNMDIVNDKLFSAGAVVLRGFKPLAVQELGEAIGLLGGDEVFYKGGLGPRTKVGERVYTASDINKKFTIKLHQEMSYQQNFPDNVVFYCDTPAKVGGETTLAGMRLITSAIPDTVRRKFSDLGVRYVSVFHDKSRRLREFSKIFRPLYLQLTWQDAFGSACRERVEEECRRRELMVTWRKNGDLETTAILPAFRTHPVTQDTVWFNSVLSLHFNKIALRSDYGDLVYYARKFYAGGDPRNLPNQVYYGDGSDIPLEDIMPLYDAYERFTYPHPWQQGDLMLLDNRLVAHGRNSFRGPRKVLASLLAGRFETPQSYKNPLSISGQQMGVADATQA